MPPNADCWLAKIENLIQVSIEAVEYFAAAAAVSERPPTLSKALPTKAWAKRFGKSETWVKDQIRDQWEPSGLAKRNSERGSVRISLELLAEMGVDHPE